MGIHSTVGGNDYREYIQVQLNSALQANEKYCVRFFVCLSDSAAYAVNDIGAYFSNSPISSASGQVLPYSPQAKNNPATNPLNQRNVWLAITDSFIAQGGEQYITIGNFKDDTSVDTSSVPGGVYWGAGYYYIDSVFVGSCNIVGGIKGGYGSATIEVFPNPSSENITVNSLSTEIEKIVLYNYLGEPIFERDARELIDRRKIILDINTLSDGIYFLYLYTQKGFTTHKILIN